MTSETPTPSEDVNVQQGMIEQSNVVPIVEMTTMIDVMRAYTASAQMMKQADDLNEKAIATLGKA